MGDKSRSYLAVSENGGIALAEIAKHQLGDWGYWVLAATVTLACLKTAVGLITSCSEAFKAIFPKGPSYRLWAILFTVVSFLIATVGLSSITSYSAPVLMFLYPLAMVLILLALFGRYFHNDRAVYAWAIAFTLISAVYDLLFSLPANVRETLHLNGVITAIGNFLPLSDLGLGWVCPALIGLLIGLAVHFCRTRKQQAA